MKVLLTGGNGFVGSHLLDRLVANGIPTQLLLRRSAALRWVECHLHNAPIGIHYGSLSDPTSLKGALLGITHVIHCAGATKAASRQEFFRANQGGTSNLLKALSEADHAVKQIIFISSLAASRPATSSDPAQEEDSPQPVSAYGQSKQAAEETLKAQSPSPYLIIRPPVVYGPRDTEFFRIFQSFRYRYLPLLNRGKQELSLIYVKDLAAVVLSALLNPRLTNETLNVATVQAIRVHSLLEEVAKVMRKTPTFIPLPVPVLWPACLTSEFLAKWTATPTLLSRDKYKEIRAPGWVADTTKLHHLIDDFSPTSLEQSLDATVKWYSQQGWL